MEDYENPYAPPKASLNPEETEPLNFVPEASKTKRFLNHLIDTVVIYILSFLFGFITTFISRYIFRNYENQTWIRLFAYLIIIFYYILMEGTTQRTIGKLLTKTKVVNNSGNKPSLGQIVGRTFSRLIPFEALSFFGSRDNGWHDRISGTKVIDLSSENLKNLLR